MRLVFTGTTPLIDKYRKDTGKLVLHLIGKDGNVVYTVSKNK